MRPIIIVPPSLQPGSLCLGNIAQFLEKGVYTDDKTDRLQPVQVKKKLCGREVVFDVYDSVAGFTETRWKRVVAVIVSGEEWQFKDWKAVIATSSTNTAVAASAVSKGRPSETNSKSTTGNN